MRRRRRSHASVLAALCVYSLFACGSGEQSWDVTAPARETVSYAPELLEPAPLDTSIAAFTVNAPPALPVNVHSSGPAILHVQVLLDRVSFSPGILDGHWGKNTEKAVRWFQQAHGLPATGSVDTATYEQLHRLGGDGEAIMLYGVTRADVTGPFTRVPSDMYAKAELSCLCHESPLEAVSERFHSTPELLAELNPDVELGNLTEGTALWVPNVEEQTSARFSPKTVARVVISKQDFYTHGLDRDGRILFHFPSTLGSRYDPSPNGRLKVAAITHMPHFHYQPTLFAEVPDHEPEAMLPPGANSPVGVVWIALSKRHYGIHGTAEPRTIGYTSSHGCVRLTNWDARLLAHHTRPGTPVEFR